MDLIRPTGINEKPTLVDNDPILVGDSQDGFKLKKINFSTLRSFLATLFVGLTGSQTIDGVKTHTSFPVTPSTLPTSQYQVSNKRYVDEVDSVRFNAGNSGTTKTINWNQGRRQYMTMTGNCTITMSNPVEGRTYILEVTQDATGGRTIVLPSTVKTQGATAIVLSTAPNTKDLITLYFDGTNYLTNLGKNYA